jgi:hypothetical protein
LQVSPFVNRLKALAKPMGEKGLRLPRIFHFFTEFHGWLNTENYDNF